MILEETSAVISKLLGEAATSMLQLYAGRIDPCDADAFASAKGINGVLVVDDHVDPADFMQIAQAFSSVPPLRGRGSVASMGLGSEGVVAGDSELADEQRAVSLLLKRSLLPVNSELENALKYLNRSQSGIYICWAGSVGLGGVVGFRCARLKRSPTAQFDFLSTVDQIGEEAAHLVKSVHVVYGNRVA